MISISALWGVVLAVIGAVLTVMNIVDKAQNFSEKAKKPDEEQNARIAALENKVASIESQLTKHDGYFAADNERMEHMEQSIRHSNRIIIQSLQSLIANALDGNNIEQLQNSKKALDDYLLDR